MSEADLLDRILASYHEAAHVVVAYAVGWFVHHRLGVVLNDHRQRANLQCAPSDNTAEASALVSVAGNVGERKLGGIAYLPRAEDDYLVSALARVRNGAANLREDDMSALDRLLQAYPGETDGQLIARYRMAEDEAAALLSERWATVERVAQALRERGRLTRRMVERLVWSDAEGEIAADPAK